MDYPTARAKGAAMNLILDCRAYAPNNLFRGYGSEMVVRRIAEGLAAAGHRVDVITPHSEHKRALGAYWWPYHSGPKECDVLIACEGLERIDDFNFEQCIMRLNRVNPHLAGKETRLWRAVSMSEPHKGMLLSNRPTLKPEQVVVIPHGVEPEQYQVVTEKIKHRFIWCNSPDRGLIHLARIWPKLRERLPDATLSLCYGFKTYFEDRRFAQDTYAQEAWEIHDWMEGGERDGILIHDRLEREQLVQEQLLAEAMVYPADCTFPGVLAYSISVLECAAAGVKLLLSDAEGFPSGFGDCARILPLPIVYQDWVEEAVRLVEEPTPDTQKRLMAGYQLAATNTAEAEVKAWCALVEAAVQEKVPA